MPLPHELLEQLHMVEIFANPEDTQLGISPTMPPGPITQKNDPPHGTWADAQGVEAGSVIVFINNEYAEDMTQPHVISALKARPLQIVFAPPLHLGQDVKKLGVSFNKPSTGRVRAGTVAQGGWGESMGLMTGDILMTVNHQITEKLDDKDFIHALQSRPVTMGIQRMRMSLLIDVVSIGREEMIREEVEMELVNLQGHLKDLEDQQHDHLHEIEQLHDQLDAAKSAGGDAAEVAATNMGLRGELNELVIKSEADADALVDLESQLKTAQEDIEALEKELDDARERAPAGDGHADAEALRKITDDYHGVLQKLKEMEAARDELYKEVEQLKSENAQLKSGKSATPATGSSSTPPVAPAVGGGQALEETTKLKKEVEQLKSENAQLKSQTSATTTAASSATADLVDAQAAAQQAKDEIAQLKKEVSSLREHTTKLERDAAKAFNQAAGPSAGPSPTVNPQVLALVKKIKGQVMDKGYSFVLDRLKKIFKEVDNDESGELELKEFEAMIQLLQLDVTNTDIRMMFNLFDSDGEGSISFDEFSSAFKPGAKPPASERQRILVEKLRDKFKRQGFDDQLSKFRQLFQDVDMDSGNTGLMDLVKFQNVCLTFGLELPPKEAQTLFNAFDHDQTKAISYSEFLAVLGPNEEEASASQDAAAADAKALRMELDKALDALETERARTTAALQTRVGPQGAEEVKALRTQLAAARDELDAASMEQATAVNAGDVKESLKWANTVKQCKSELDEARQAEERQSQKLSRQTEVQEQMKSQFTEEVKAARAESKSLEDEVSKAEKAVAKAKRGGDQTVGRMTEELEEQQKSAKMFMTELYAFEANARTAVRDAKQASSELQAEARQADRWKAQLAEAEEQTHAANENARASFQEDLDRLWAELEQGHRNLERAESDTLREEVHLEGIIHRVQAESYQEEISAKVLRNQADPIFEIEFQTLRDEYLESKAQSKAYKAAHNAPQAQLIHVLKQTELDAEYEYSVAKQLREEVEVVRNELNGVMVRPPPSPNKFSWTGRRKPEVPESPAYSPQVKLNPGIVESLNQDQVQQLQQSVREAAVVGATARRDFVDGGSDGAGNVDALQSALNEALQAEEAWSRASSLMESAAGVQVNKDKVAQESDRNFKLKSELDSLWLALNDKKSEMKVTHDMPPPPAYNDGALGQSSAPPRPPNFPIQEGTGGPRAPPQPGNGLESRAQKIRKDAEDLHAEVGRWRAGHGAHMTMNKMRERRGAPPMTGYLGQYEDTPLIPFRQEDLDSIKAIRTGTKEAVDMLPLVPTVGQQRAM